VTGVVRHGQLIVHFDALSQRQASAVAARPFRDALSFDFGLNPHQSFE
jgi:hypothetical protein